MKFRLFLNQAGVVHSGLLGRVDVAALCVLYYICGWISCGKAKRVKVDGHEFVWVSYRHAVNELPLVFNPGASVETLKNQFSRLVRKLRDVGLVESVKVGRDLYLRPTDLAASVVNYCGETVGKSAHTATPPRDDTVMLSHDDTVTSPRDDSSSTHIDETIIKETNINEPTPHSPPSGEREREACSHSSVVVEEIYKEYPKSVGKPAALRAIKRALKSHSAEWLLDRTKLFAATYNGESQYIPNPSTWFNQERFNDEPATWVRSANRTSLNRPAPPPRRFDPSKYQQPLENL